MKINNDDQYPGLRMKAVRLNYGGWLMLMAFPWNFLGKEVIPLLICITDNPFPLLMLLLFSLIFD